MRIELGQVGEEARDNTNASLGAERARDASEQRILATERRVLDDLIERDRLLADENLLKFRVHADTLLALERLASPTRDKALAREREMADSDKRAERLVTDGALEQERHRADLACKEDRRKQGVEHFERQALRQDTDIKLGAERTRADAVQVALENTSEALSSATDERGRRNDLLAMVSHDLRSPLTVIALSGSFLLDEAKDASTREVAQDIVRSAARMERLLTDLLDVARIESGTLAVCKEGHDVGELLQEVSRSYRPLFAARRLEFSVGELAAPLVASFDHDRIVQVLSNLLGNALKFTPANGQVRLLVRRRRDDVELEVHNTGPAIPAATLAHVFERFWQASSDAGRGLGLGLYICQQIVEAHGGQIAAESVPNRGTQFRFTLPLA